MAKEQLKQLQKQRVKIDRRVTTAITMGGWLVLVMLLALVWHLISVTRPILSSPSFELDYQITSVTQNPVIQVAQWDNRRWQFSLQDNCDIEVNSHYTEEDSRAFLVLPDKASRFPQHCAASQQLVTSKTGGYLLKLSPSGILRVFQFNRNNNNFSEQLFSTLLPPQLNINSLENMQAVIDSHHLVLLARDSNRVWRFIRFDMHNHDFQIELTLPGMVSDASSLTEEVASSHSVSLSADYQILHSEKLDLVYSAKQLYLLDESALKAGKPQPSWQVFREADKPNILALISLATERSVLLMNHELELEKWSLINQNGRMVLQKIYQLPLQGQNFKGMTHVNGDLVVALVDTQAYFINATTGEVLNSENHQLNFDKAWFPGESVVFERKDSFVSMNIADADATISFKSLWGKVWYDGYPQPDYVWQTSSASDESQPKYSLIPLVMGSVKAAFLALIVAIPLAIGSAIYSGYYAAPKVRRVIKPYIEVLEAIPSVVIGFIAVIWLLPVSENYLLATLLFFVVTPVFLLLFTWLNNTGRHLNVPGWELAFFAGILVVYITIFQLVLMDSPSFLSNMINDESGFQNNTELKTIFVLALALGIAIVPTVFTIAEDAIHQVPRALPMASFALGANRSQTLLKIVLKVAMPGIISAIMLGFARAVGETMIVLMISGNTPVADWGILEGIRTMTANLAIELPEAQPGSVHYQILFLVALLLFVFTFVFNTLAEFLRLQLRNRYKL